MFWFYDITSMKKVSPMESMTFIWKFDRKGESHGLMVLYWKDHKETCSIGKDVFVMWFLRKRFVRYETTWGVSPIETDAKEWKFFHLNELKHKSGMEVSCSGFFVPEKKGRGCTLALFYLLKYFPCQLSVRFRCCAMALRTTSLSRLQSGAAR